MNPLARTAAVFLLALMLPIQGWAAACAQICALASAGHDGVMIHDAVPHDAHAQSAAPEAMPGEGLDHCGKSELGAGKCCQAHTYLAKAPTVFPHVSIPSFERHRFVSRWTSFVSEEPTPPPIASAPLA